MTNRDKQRLDELEEKTAYLMARQAEQTIQLNRIMARLTYVESRQYHIMKELGLEPDTLDSPQTAKNDAQSINLGLPADQRLN